MKACGLILAGGKSSRMGRDKTLLTIGGETMIERTVNEMRKAVDEVIIVSNTRDKYHLPGVKEATDIYPQMGPLGGIHAGLLATDKDYAFVVAGDMPLFNAEVARFILSHAPGFDVVVPCLFGKLEPLCAVYSRCCIAPIDECLRAGEKQVLKLYPKVRVREIDEREMKAVGNTEEIFLNLNTPAEYEAFCRRAGG